MDKNSDELVAELGDNLFEVKRLLTGGFCAYSVNDRATGKTIKEALSNLLEKVKKPKERIHEPYKEMFW